ncbi:MAG: hypothetical protein N2Z22_01270 [Turneriella sp.]|nr:hypothetical protein [Turneriella sp.]
MAQRRQQAWVPWLFAGICFALGCSSKKIRIPMPSDFFERREDKTVPPTKTEEKPVQQESEEAVASLKKEPPALPKKTRRMRSRLQFSGDEFIKETGFNPFEQKNDTVVRLKGHARVSARNVRITSPAIEIYGNDGNLAYAHGPVEILDSRTDTRVSAAEALFIRQEHRAILRGNAQLSGYLRGKKERQKVRLMAQELERDFETAISQARGNVVATGRQAVLYAKMAEYRETQDVVRSENEPRIFYGSDLFLADKIQWHVSAQTVDFRGNVRAFFQYPEEGQKKPVESAVRATEGTLQQGKQFPFGQKVTLRKNVMVERKAYSAYCDIAEIFGPGAELVRAEGNVVLFNAEDNTRSYGEEFEWVKASGKLTLRGKKQNRTRTIFYNKNQQPVAEVAATLVTRENTTANPQARGNVTIMQYGRDQAAVYMGAEWAELVRARKAVLLHGSPYIEGEMGRIHAREIILHYEEQRYEMLGILPGLVEKKINP